MAQWPYSTRRWQQLRLLKLQADPLCEECKARGQTVPAKHVDHIRAISDGGDPFPDLGGLRSLCPSCHSRKTTQDDGLGAAKGWRRRGRGVDPATGRPLDSEHWWNK